MATKSILNKSVNDAEKVISKFNNIKVRCKFNGEYSQYKQYYGFAFFPEWLKMLTIKHVYVAERKEGFVLYLTVEN